MSISAHILVIITHPKESITPNITSLLKLIFHLLKLNLYLKNYPAKNHISPFRLVESLENSYAMNVT
ncbi:hypothetical protein HI914_05156 [Erysiphe necator]|nr:hypothetical protein HI914_05156 [Erysiphe necator]